MVIKGYRVGPLLKATGKEILDDHVLGLSAEMAYYFFFSLFPLLLFLTPLAGLFLDPTRVLEWLQSQIGQTVPQPAMEILQNVIQEVEEERGAPGLISLGAVLALWAGSNVFNALINALNRAFDIEEGRPWWKKRLIAIAAAVAALVIIIVAATVFLAGPQLVAWATGAIGLGGMAATIWTVVQYTLAYLLVVGLFFCLYYFLPNLKGQRWKHVLVGAVVGATLWIAATLIFRFYVQNFANYQATYGAIGGVIVMLLWMYLTMLVILSAGELVSELEHRTGAIEPRAGATYTGRIATGDTRARPSNERRTRIEPLTARGPEGEGR